MADLFYDAFEGSGSVANRTPDVGNDWASGSVGSVDGGLVPVVSWFGGYSRGTIDARTSRYITLPASKILTLDVVLNLGEPDDRGYFEIYLMDSASAKTLRFYLDVLPYNPTFPYMECLPALSEWEGQGVPNVSSVLVPGSNHVILSMDYDARTVTLYVNDVLSFTGTIPEGGESWTIPPATTTLMVAVEAGNTYGAGAPMYMSVDSIRITDEPPAQPAAGEFWTGIVRAIEIP